MSGKKGDKDVPNSCDTKFHIPVNVVKRMIEAMDPLSSISASKSAVHQHNTYTAASDKMNTAVHFSLVHMFDPRNNKYGNVAYTRSVSVPITPCT